MNRNIWNGGTALDRLEVSLLPRSGMNSVCPFGLPAPQNGVVQQADRPALRFKDSLRGNKPGMRSRSLLNWVGMFVSLLFCGAAASGEPQSERESFGPGQTETAADSSATGSELSSTDSRPLTPQAQNLTGRGSEEVEASLGKPAGKLQTAQGAVWFYAERKVHFDQKGRVLKVEKDKPMRLVKLDPQFVAAADAVAKAEAERAAADDAARVKASALQAADVRLISNGGQEVDLPSLLAEDKITIVDFYADWCGPCRQISPELERLAKEDPDVVLLKIDIVNWNTPVTRQFGISSVPNMRVFNRARTQVGDGTSKLAHVRQRIQQAK